LKETEIRALTKTNKPTFPPFSADRLDPARLGAVPLFEIAVPHAAIGQLGLLRPVQRLRWRPSSRDDESPSSVLEARAHSEDHGEDLLLFPHRLRLLLKIPLIGQRKGVDKVKLFCIAFVMK
jgi:hypothetical protein